MRVAKAVTASIGAVVSILTVAFADDVFSASEVGTVIATVIEQCLTVYAVFRIPNKDV